MPNIEQEPEDVTKDLEAFAVVDDEIAEETETSDQASDISKTTPKDDDAITIDMSEEDSDKEPSSDDEPNEDVDEPNLASSGQSRFKRFKHWYTTHKKISIPLTILAALAVLLAIPVTRYAILGTFISKDVQVTVTDSENHIPVSGVDVSLKGKAAKTDGQGKATISGVKVGPGTLTATKKYYKDYSQNVTVTVNGTSQVQFGMQATGRQIPVKVTSKITNAAIVGAKVTVSDAEGETDQNGAVTLVLPADQPTQKGTIYAQGYNDLAITIDLNKTSVSDNTFSMTPSGKIYFLSKRTGKIDVVKTNLDGSDRQTVLAGTGGEEDSNTVLLASRDWKYLALQARRENGQTRLYLITTSDDSVIEIDSGDNTFSPVGWSEHAFVYTSTRNNVPLWQPKGAALKAYNADSKQSTVLDETSAEGTSSTDYVNENFGNIYIMKDAVVYVKQWYHNYYSAYRLAGKRSGLYQVKPSGGKQTIKDFDAASTSSISTVLSKPEELYVAVYDMSSKATYYEYVNNTLAAANDVTAETFGKFYPTYLVSPAGAAVFWDEPRDGKNTLFTANLQLDNPKQLATTSDFTAYGWYTDAYLLLSKNGSELYIGSSNGSGGQPLKITDYHKPARSFDGYGYGYGGQ